MSKDLSDESAELALLSLAFANTKALDKPEFKAGLFTGERRTMAKLMLQIRSTGKKVDAGNIRLVGKSEDLGTLADQLSVRTLGGSFDLLIERLREIRIRGKLAVFASKYHELAYDEKQPIRGIVEDFEAEAMVIRGTRTANVQNGGDYNEIIDLIQWRQSHPGQIRGLSTGFTQLDNLIDGLLARYFLLGARTSVGKTSWALNVCAALLAARKRVIYFAGEDPEQIKMRLLSIIARVPTGRMDRPYTPEESRAISKSITQIQGFDWILDDTPNPSIAYIRSTTRRLNREKPLDLIVIDYVQLCTASHARRDDKRAVLDEVSKGIKANLKEVPCCHLVLSQLRRKEGIFDHKSKTTEPGRPELSDLKESGSLEEDADAVGLLHRNQKDASSHAEFMLAKNKDGPTRDILLNFLAENYYFSER